jgi:hypothetical protein
MAASLATTHAQIGIMPLDAQLILSFDRPYLLMLRDSLTGEPLMLAWVANPAGS